MRLSLRREPRNEHDRNAVAVFSGNSKLGYLPRQLAAELAAYFDRGGEYGATLVHLGRRTHQGKEYPGLSIRIELHGIAPPSGLQELELAARRLSGQRGVYEILNRVEGRSYIGSAADIGGRLTTHLQQLHNGTHANPALLSAWRRHGAASFEFRVIETVPDHRLREREAFHINQRRTYLDGYNRTKDGEGVKPPPSTVRSSFQPPPLVTNPNPIAPQTPLRRVVDLNAIPPSGKAMKKGSGCLILLVSSLVVLSLMIIM